MLSIYNIWTVARFEIRTLSRSWFFRIFFIVSLLILTALNLLLFTGWTQAPWMLRGLASSIPYTNLLLLNILQAIIAVFLASDFLKRDTKLDTTEVVYMRSMTNADYVLGKTVGIMILFIGLNILVLLIAGVINAVASDVPLSLTPYLIYPLLISVPTLIFILGLSFLLMVLIRNQAVTFIILLGYIAISLFFLGGRAGHLYDYMAFSLPMPFSDFVGFGNCKTLCIQRGIYFLAGTAAIFLTVLKIKRLPQSRAMQRLSLAITTLSIAGAAILAGLHLSMLSHGRTVRKEMIALNKEYGDEPVVSIENCELELLHRGAEIEARAVLSLVNQNQGPMDRLIFRLNPGLKVEEVTGEHRLSFERNLHLIVVNLDRPLGSGAAAGLTVKYRGTIDEQACYLDVPEADRTEQSRAWMLNLEKRHAFITPDYVLLTPESNWIPRAGAGFCPDRPVSRTVQFSRYQLEVRCADHLTVISQGSRAAAPDGVPRFSTERPIPMLSLVIGPYQRKFVVVDSVEYSLHVMPGHDYFSPYFQALSDTLPSLIRDIRTGYESNLNANYPYNRLSLVEVPVQFMGYQRLWTLGYETVQPEMILIPEKGVTLPAADFKMFQRWESRRPRRSEEVLTPVESQSRMFRMFTNFTLVSSSMPRRFGQGPGTRVAENIELPNLTRGQAFEMSYSVYPNYYTFVNHLHSQKWPILNFAFESYLSTQGEDQRMQMFRAFSGLSADEEIGLLLNRESISRVLQNIENAELAHEAMKAKGNTLFTRLKSQLGSEEFERYIMEFLAACRYRSVAVDELIIDLEDKYGIDFASQIEAWYEIDRLPGFIMTDVSAYQIVVDDRTKYQIRLTLSNPEPVSGDVIVSFRTRGGGPGGFFAPQSAIERIVTLEPQQSKAVGIVLDSAPRMMTVNTLLSQNLPSVLMQFFEDIEEKRTASPIEGENVVDPPAMIGPHEIIVDNEDPGFEVESGSDASPLRRLLRKAEPEDEPKYQPLMGNRDVSNWTATANPAFYGRYIHSAHFIHPGEGDKRVAWRTEIEENGSYDVYAHVFSLRFRGPGRGRGRGQGGRDAGRQDYHYIVNHDDGIEEVVIEANETEDGWVLLGSFYFSGEARIELTDRSEGPMIFADAVRLIKQ